MTSAYFILRIEDHVSMSRASSDSRLRFGVRSFVRPSLPAPTTMALTLDHLKTIGLDVYEGLDIDGRDS